MPMIFSRSVGSICLSIFSIFYSLTLAQANTHQSHQEFLDSWRRAKHVRSVVVSLEDTLTGQVENYASGTIRLRRKAPVTTENIFGVGSITKTFIAAAILQLQEEKRLKLDDSLGLYFPQYPRWKTITIRQLLNMTSGITNYTSLPLFYTLQESSSRKAIPAERFIKSAYLTHDKFRPGTGWYYSNTNYTLLGLLIEKLTKQSLETVLTQRFFQPLHLNHTFYTDSFYPKSVIQEMAHAYDDERDITNWNFRLYGAAGAMVMNAGDLRTWTAALLTPNVILKKASIQELQTTLPIPPSPPKPLGARFGLGIYSLNTKEEGTIWYYAGIVIGYTSCFISIPSQHKIIVAQVATFPEKDYGILFPGKALMNEFLEK